jgi:hypothetical protein
MNSKNQTKSKKNNASLQSKIPNKKQSSLNNKFIKITPKRYETSIKITAKKIPNKFKSKQKLFQKPTKQINNEDSSTNCLSGSNCKKTNLEINYLNNNINKNKEEYIIPSLFLKNKKESETESFFINFKLGEKDSYMDSVILKPDKKIEKDDIFKKINLKNNTINQKYNYCKVNKDCGQNENDSLEIYDFNDETNVDYVLKNMSALSCNKTCRDENSNIFEDCDEMNNSKAHDEKIINNIKIFEINNNITNLCEKNK